MFCFRVIHSRCIQELSQDLVSLHLVFQTLHQEWVRDLFLLFILLLLLFLLVIIWVSGNFSGPPNGAGGVVFPPPNHPPPFQLPDFSKPPPGFPPPGVHTGPHPAPNSQPNAPIPGVPVPPAPEESKPTVPYYELPAGLMAPLVKVYGILKLINLSHFIQINLPSYLFMVCSWKTPSINL